MKMQIKEELDNCEGYEVEELKNIGTKYTRHDNLVAYIINEKENKIEVISYKHNKEGEVMVHAGAVKAKGTEFFQKFNDAYDQDGNAKDTKSKAG